MATATIYVISPRGVAVPVDYDERTATPAEVSQTYLQLEEMLKSADPESAESYAKALGAKEVALPQEEAFSPRVWALAQEGRREEIGVLVRGESLHTFADLEDGRYPIALRYSERGEVAIALPPEVYERLTGQQVSEPVAAVFPAERLGLREEELAAASRYLSMEARLEREAKEGWLSAQVLDYLEERERLEAQTKEVTGKILRDLEAELTPARESLTSPEELLARREVGTIVDDRGNREGYYLLEIAPDGRVEKVVISSGEMGDVSMGEWYGENQQRMAQETAQTLRYSSREEDVAEKIHPSVGQDEQEAARRAQARLGGLTPPEKDEEPEI